MAIKLSQEAKFLLGIAAIAVVLMGLVAAAADSNDEQELSLSTYSSRSGGAKATYTLLQELGYKTERWNFAPSALPDDAQGTLFIVLAPDRMPNEEERRAINKFAGRGGTLLVADAVSGRLLADLDLRYDLPSKSWESYAVKAPHPLNRDVEKITMPKGSYAGCRETDVPLYGDGEKCMVVIVPRGKGRIVWLASPVPLSNAGLKAAGNAEFVGNVAALFGSRSVLWDVYFSGDEPRKHSPYRVPALLAGSAQLLFIFGLIVFTHSRRSGPVRMFQEGPQPMSQMEFVDTLGSLYQSAKATNVTVRIAYTRFAFLAARRFATSPANLEMLSQAIATATGEPAGEILEFMTRCENIQYHAALSNEEAMKQVQRLHAYSVKLKLIPDTTQEKH